MARPNHKVFVMESAAVQSFLFLLLLGFWSSITAKQFIMLIFSLVHERLQGREQVGSILWFILSLNLLVFLLVGISLPFSWKFTAALMGVSVSIAPSVLEMRAIDQAKKGR